MKRNKVCLRSLAGVEHIANSTAAIRNANTWIKLAVGTMMLGLHNTLPKKPDTDLTPIKVPILGLKAVGICNSANMEKQIR